MCIRDSFSTWFQGWLVGFIGRSSWGWLQALARTIAGLAAGFVQMVVLFPMEKFVLLKEKKMCIRDRKTPVLK